MAFKEEEGAELLEAAAVGSQRRDLCLHQLYESLLSSCSLRHRAELGRSWKLTGSVIVVSANVRREYAADC